MPGPDGSEPVNDPRPAATPAGSWLKLLVDATPLVALAGGVAYAALRVAYLAFYLRLRTTPEEVGYGYAEVLAGTLLGAMWLVILVATLLTVAFWLAVAAGRSARRALDTFDRFVALRTQVPTRSWPGPGRSLPDGLGFLTAYPTPPLVPWPPRQLAVIVRRAMYLGSALVLVGLPWLAWVEGGLAARGLTVRMLYMQVVGVPVVPVLAVQAESASVVWLGERADALGEIASRPCLVYLGKDTTFTVFFDVRSQESLRLPSDSIAVRLAGREYVPDECF